jgi:UDP-N-acetylglucosamine acyltransferase
MIGRLKKSYRLLFRSGLTLSEAVSRVEGELGGADEIEELLAFIRTTKRGICR